MSTRRKDGKPGTESPRLKDTPILPPGTGRQRSDGRDASGRFVGGNGAANGRAAKYLVKESLGRDADPQLVHETLTMYRAIVRDLPSDGPSVRALVASRCRHAALATRFASEATKVGLTTAAGLKLAEQSRAHDLAAQRLAVTAHDLAIRDARARADEQGAAIDPLAIDVTEADDEHAEEEHAE